MNVLHQISLIQFDVLTSYIKDPMIKYCLFSILWIALTLASFGQPKPIKIIDTKIVLIENPTQSASFTGGSEALSMHVAARVVLPNALKSSKAQTTIMTEAIITKTGALIEPRVMSGSFDEAFNEQLMKALREAPKWKPALLGTDSVATKVTIPIVFR